MPMLEADLQLEVHLSNSPLPTCKTWHMGYAINKSTRENWEGCNEQLSHCQVQWHHGRSCRVFTACKPRLYKVVLNRTKRDIIQLL